MNVWNPPKRYSYNQDIFNILDTNEMTFGELLDAVDAYHNHHTNRLDLAADIVQLIDDNYIMMTHGHTLLLCFPRINNTNPK